MKEIDRSCPYEGDVLDRLHRLHVEMIQDIKTVCERNNITFFAVFGTALGAERHKGFIPWDDDTDIGMLRKDYDKFLGIVEQEMGEKYRIMTPEVDDRYACNVTKQQRKGTTFISHLSKQLECEQCIFVDIFPFDFVAPKKGQARRQQLFTVFFDRLLYLCGTPYPVIPYTGIMHSLASAVCICIHYGIRLFHVSSQNIYRKYKQYCTKYNEHKSGIVTSFGEGNSLGYRISVKNMFPVKEVPFEDITIPVLNNNKEHLQKVYGDYMQIPPKDKQINHAPYIIRFEGEEEIVNGRRQL